MEPESEVEPELEQGDVLRILREIRGLQRAQAKETQQLKREVRELAEKNFLALDRMAGAVESLSGRIAYGQYYLMEEQEDDAMYEVPREGSEAGSADMVEEEVVQEAAEEAEELGEDVPV